MVESVGMPLPRSGEPIPRRDRSIFVDVIQRSRRVRPDEAASVSSDGPLLTGGLEVGALYESTSGVQLRYFLPAYDHHVVDALFTTRFRCVLRECTST